MSSTPSKSSAPSSPDASPLTIVGIGASAGGLSALKTFFAHVPEESGLAFVVVVHLSPDGESHLADILQPKVKMPVQQVTETVPIEANHVYIIPPGCNLDTIDTHLRLSELEEKRRDRAPIDHFFRTLAAMHDGNAVGVILSGTGSDGTLGIREIKGAGGLTLVQDPNEAEYDGMPQSAIATGLIDAVLPLAEIPPYIIRYAHTQPQITVVDPTSDAQHDESLLHKIVAVVKNQTGRDFTHYKLTTIMRRLRRRMQLVQLERLTDYLDLLRRDPEEVSLLSNDFLITVTSFFRDPPVFEALQQRVIPRLMAEPGVEHTVRVWSVGCSTGEEAYSLAMLLLEEAARHDAPPEIQVFASDLHQQSLLRAREGFYPGDIKVDVSEERLRRFFTGQEGGYRIRKEVRDRVVFAPHNLMSDPPFSKIDLIVCRNVLIYLQRRMQHDVIDLFHYALHPGGTLLLGSSETIESSELFHTEDKQLCLFRKRNVPPPELHLPVFPVAQARPSSGEATDADEAKPIVYGALHQKIVERFAPPSLLLNPDHRVVHLSERAGQYLLHPGGELTANVFKLVPPELHLELRMALHNAQHRQQLVRTKPVRVTLREKKLLLSLSVFPDQDPQQAGFSVVVFEELGDLSSLTSPVSSDASDSEDNSTEVVRDLQSDLDRTNQRLQSIVEEYETSQEEMKASNEELQSTNEELRSTMEELETSKEELQSMNEELSTLNQENRHKVEELSQLSGDLQNLLAATDIATLFLDREFRIMRFTPRASELFSVRHLDRGRPLSDLTNRLGYANMQDDARRVLSSLVPVEREVQDDEQRWYLTRVLPYRSTDDRIEGVVITFIDITQRRQSEEELRESEEHLRLILESATDYAIFTLNVPQTITDWNSGAERIFGYQRSDIVGQSVESLFVPEDRPMESQRDKSRVQAQGKSLFERWYLRKDGTRFWGTGALMPLRQSDQQIRGYLGIMVDNTERRQMEQELRQAKDEAERAAQVKEDFLAHMSHEIRTPLNAIVGLTGLLLGNETLPEQRDFLKGIGVSSDNLVALVNDILDFSKIAAGKTELEQVAFNLTELLGSLEATHGLSAQQHGNQLSIELSDDLPTYGVGDPTKLSQVLNNLLSNAIKFTQDGQVTLAVELAPSRGDQLTLHFSVQDTGVGIAADQLEAVFEKFTQADNSTKRNYGGTGLGLSITKSLLELMGSRIAVESEVGTGTRFYFDLPFERVAAPPDSAIPPRTETLPGPVDRPLRLLLVEDMAINRMVLQQYLNVWWQVEAHEAENGAEAIELIEKNDYDLVLMDVRMPVMDGHEAVAIIRGMESPQKSQVPVLALTADTKEKVVVETANHFTEVITKPFDPAELRHKIFQHLRLPLPSPEQ